MHSSAQIRLIALAVAATVAVTSAPASAQSQHHDDDWALPLTPPSPESSNPRYERTPTTHSPGSAGLALLVLCVAPIGIALGGSSFAAAPDNIASPLPMLEVPRVAPPPAPATPPH
jgi:hypothetical protein